MVGGLGNEVVDKYELSILCSIYVGHVKSKYLEIEKEISGQCTFTNGSIIHDRSKGKAVPLQARRGPEGSRKLRFPDFVTTAQDGGKVVSLTYQLPLLPGNAPGTHFC